MSEERYRLVFRGELLDGQHPAVVKKRLEERLKLQPERLEQLFTGKPVVLKQAADTRTAARFQAAFKGAGARLRVLPTDAPLPGEASAVVEPSASGRTRALSVWGRRALSVCWERALSVRCTRAFSV